MKMKLTVVLGLQQNAYREVIINGAQRFMCPDTLH
jgi:hypothetical protein